MDFKIGDLFYVKGRSYKRERGSPKSFKLITKITRLKIYYTSFNTYIGATIPPDSLDIVEQSVLKEYFMKWDSYVIGKKNNLIKMIFACNTVKNSRFYL